MIGIVDHEPGDRFVRTLTFAITAVPGAAATSTARLTADAGDPLRAGDMAGGATAAVALRPNIHVRVVVEKRGQTEFRTAPA